MLIGFKLDPKSLLRLKGLGHLRKVYECLRDPKGVKMILRGLKDIHDR